MAVKRKEGERLDEENVSRVIEHLEKGGKKKDAYDILNIKANPTRLAKIIEEYHQRIATAEKIRKANRGKPASKAEIAQIVVGALEGTAVSNIAEELYRPVSFVNNIIESMGIPRKGTGSWWDRRFQSSIPDKCVSDSFDINEIVWSDKYNGLAFVRGVDEKGVYSIFVIEKIEEEAPFAIGGIVYTGYGGFFANQRVEELGSLKHLSELGVDLYSPFRPYFRNWI